MGYTYASAGNYCEGQQSKLFDPNSLEEIQFINSKLMLEKSIGNCDKVFWIKQHIVEGMIREQFYRFVTILFIFLSQTMGVARILFRRNSFRGRPPVGPGAEHPAAGEFSKIFK